MQSASMLSRSRLALLPRAARRQRSLLASARLSGVIPQQPQLLSRRQLRNASSQAAPSVSPSPVKLDLPELFASAPSELRRAVGLAKAILTSDSVPSAEQTEKALAACAAAARRLTADHAAKPEPKPAQDDNGGRSTSSDSSGPASALLSSFASSPTSSATTVGQREIIELLAFHLMKHPTVFITPKALSTYVSLQSLLGDPWVLPAIFMIYATKPTPVPNTDPSQYKARDRIWNRSAIPDEAANAALDAAIAIKDLPLALEIIGTTFGDPAYQLEKVTRKAFLPLTGLVLSPVASYAVAATLARYQTSMAVGTATGIAFAGILTYLGATATIGLVAVTTANDQMMRVTWATGMPLRERWLREEERAACDRVAVAWGFPDKHRWGEEEGADWQMLREWLGVRGMVLDRVSLMEGME